ncbi:hypothetical protein B9J09_09850 [Xylella fastidiosa subsp. pauca]|uniref:hypothetical protein n=2 Tax=Xylella fastidiosa TaxID=2371 RepID=UPI000582E7D4|nr:hypothetical protein [Xylella fastidiosa]ARO69277.1 hypothetical protein B9J09_09850 [Xylella fastidiosa subsp. pauca]AVI21302.1 hypothetical protein BCV75_09145 [Xylella fastidiosa]AVI23332.1 hypothetical protein BC375_09210 [Xylella fastidiosa]KIA58790.1 hypothetical protein RA12_04155 [Xylella fastidiosa]KXB10959.1 hypothetical protein ADT32_07100 [Xylella fastidiosa]
MFVRSLRDRSRLFYFTHALLWGAPILLIGGPLSMGLLLITVLQGNGSMMTKGLILGWLGSRFLGLVGWLVLSYAFLTGGRLGLVQLSLKWWLCLMAGVPAAVFLFWFFYIVNFNGGSYHSGFFYGWGVFCLGPAVLPLTLHLLWLRCVSQRRSEQCNVVDRINPT